MLRFVGERNRRAVFKAPDDKRAGKFARLGGCEAKRGGQHLFLALEAANVLFQLAEDEVAAEAERVGDAGILDQCRVQTEGRIPACGACGGGFFFNIFGEKQRLAAAIDVTEVFDADIGAVFDGAADLFMQDGGAGFGQKFGHVVALELNFGAALIADEDHAIDLLIEVRFPLGQVVVDGGDAGRVAHAAVEKRLIGRCRRRNAQGGVAGSRQKGRDEGGAGCAGGLVSFGFPQLVIGAGEVVVGELAQGAAGLERFGGVQAEEDIEGLGAAVAFENVSLEGLEHLLFVGGSVFPGEGFGEVDGHWFDLSGAGAPHII